MTGKWWKILLVCALLAATFGYAVSGADLPPPFPKGFTYIAPGSDAYIGEEGVDISVAVPDPYTRIALFASNADPTKDTPVQVITEISNKKAYFFDPRVYTDTSQGTWYCWNGAPPAGPVAFVLHKPYIQIKAINNPTSVEVTDKKVFQGTTLNFKIESNLYPITKRDPASPGPFDINVTGPGGNTYSALRAQDGSDVSLLKIPVNNDPYYWVTALSNSGWFTGAKGPSGGNYMYSTGVYQFKVSCLANKLNLNSPTAVSLARNVEILPETLTITANTASIVRSKTFNLVINGRPNTWYYVYLKDCPATFDGKQCNQPPLIVDGQENVLFDTPYGNYTIGNTKTVPECCYPGSTIRSIVPKDPYDGTRYYALVKTDDSGTKTINLQTSVDTAAAIFTYHAQGKTIDNRDIYTNPDATVTVTKGVVTISMPVNATLGSSRFILINGTNTETLTTYLWLKGPCQPVCGAPIDSPQTPLGVPTTVKVNQDGTWSYNWTIMDLKIDAGEYTIFAASNWSCPAPTPVPPTPSPTPCTDVAYCPNKCPECCWACAAVAQTKILIERPVLEATMKPNPLIRECCNDPTVTITGRATGVGVDPVTGKKIIGLWIFGDGKIADVHYVHTTVEVKCDDTFTVSFGPNDKVFPTGKVAAGRYYFILEHPMYNRVLDIDLQKNPNDGGNRWFVSSVCPVKWSYLFPIEGPGGKYDYAGYIGVINALKEPCVDDIYKTITLTVQDVNSPGVDFTANPTGGRAPLVVNFTDISTITEVSRTWDFGDGSSSTEKNPTHVYVGDGSYSVKLSVVDQEGKTRTASKVAYINAGAVVLSAAFSASPTTGMKPLTVNFTDLSYGDPTSWFWDFGDSTFSAVQNPGSHTYQNAGNFTATLTVGNGRDASSTVSQVITVKSDQPIPPGYDKIVLFTGWNFVSSPKILQTGYDNASIFANVDTASHSIYEYDTAKGTWITLTPTSPIKVLDGLWIYSKSPTSVALKFSTDPIVVPPSKNLPSGWNAVGFSGLQPATARDTFFSVQAEWANAIGFDALGQRYETTIVNGGSGEFSDTRTLYPTKGYWLFMKSAGTLSAIGT